MLTEAVFGDVSRQFLPSVFSLALFRAIKVTSAAFEALLRDGGTAD